MHRAAENGADADMAARMQAKQGQLDAPTPQEVHVGQIAPSLGLCCTTSS